MGLTRMVLGIDRGDLAPHTADFVRVDLGRLLWIGAVAFHLLT